MALSKLLSTSISFVTLQLQKRDKMTNSIAVSCHTIHLAIVSEHQNQDSVFTGHSWSSEKCDIFHFAIISEHQNQDRVLTAHGYNCQSAGAAAQSI